MEQTSRLYSNTNPSNVPTGCIACSKNPSFLLMMSHVPYEVVGYKSYVLHESIVRDIQPNQWS